MHLRTTAVAAVLLTLFAGGCSDPLLETEGYLPAPARSGPPSPVVHDRWESCEKAAANEEDLGAQPEALNLPLLDHSFEPVAVILCSSGLQELPGGEVEQIEQEIRSDEPATVLAALRLPDADQALGPCTMDLPVVPWLALLDGDGRWIRPGIPIDECGKSRTEVREAYFDLAENSENRRVYSSQPTN